MSRAWLYPKSENPRRFIEKMSVRHPELANLVGWDDAVRIAQRESIQVRVRPMPRKINGRLLRIGHHVFVSVNSTLTRAERTTTLVHELVHFWRDDPGVGAYYSDDVSLEPHEQFADVVAWILTSPAGKFVRDVDAPF